jgi:hypothetical protein
MRHHLSSLKNLVFVSFTIPFTAIFFMVIFCLPISSRAAFELQTVAARPAALGGAYCAVSDDAPGSLHNPAAAGRSTRRTLALSAGRPFGLAELDVQQLSIVQPISRWAVNFWARRLGDDLYREVMLGLCCSRRLGDNLSAGVALRGLQLAIAGYGSDRTWCVDLGISGAVNSAVHLGMSAHNLNHAHLGRGEQAVPQLLRAGIAFRPERHVLLCADLVEDVSDVTKGGSFPGKYPVEIRLGCEGRLRRSLALRLGFQNRPLRMSGGIGLTIGPVVVDYACRSHRFLGPTQHITISWH